MRRHTAGPARWCQKRPQNLYLNETSYGRENAYEPFIRYVFGDMDQ